MVNSGRVGMPIARKTREKYDLMSLSFTNYLLIDEAFAKECQREGNLIFAMSVEGKEEDTVFRRGIRYLQFKTKLNGLWRVVQ